MTLQTTKRWIGLCGAIGALSLTTVTVAAQEAPEATTEPPITDTTPEPGQEKLPPCPMPPPVAQPAPEAAPPPAPVAHRKHNIVFAPQEVALVTGAGVGNYFGTDMPNSSLHTGATWDARVTFGSHSIIALEAGYVGGVNQISVPGQPGHLTSNGVDGDFRLQLPYRWQPYVFSGVGYNHMGVFTSDNPNVTAQVKTSDDQVTIPAGGGMAAYFGKNKHTTLDLRGTYRYIPDNGITVMNTSALHQWVAQARIGYAF